MRPLFISAALASALFLASPRAEACGGFFCSNVPIDQAGENIVFVANGNHVQAHVQIQYAGDARKFAWVLPLHVVPTLSIGSASLFPYLASRTQPVFQLDGMYGGSCGYLYPPVMADGDATAGGSGGVDVVSQDSVGPYDYAILRSSDAGALQIWLRDNQYDLTALGDDALVPYVQEGFFFVALKLQQDKGVGDLRPVVLDMETDTPCIPLRLTAIAARPDMPVTAYVLSDARAVPTNYRHVLVNETRIDWLSGGSNYASIASAAIDEAGGRAFLTEFAGPAAPLFAGATLDNALLDASRLSALPDPVDFVLEVQRQNFPRDGLLGLLTKYIPVPAALAAQGVTAQGFFNDIAAYRSSIASDPGRKPFDAQACAKELDETIVQPLRRAQAALEAQPYLTRLFTTMSPSEMTVDPEFDFNDSLGDVSHLHRATLTCSGEGPNALGTITLPDGRSFTVDASRTPLADGPAAARVEQLGSMGPAVMVKDNAPLIDAVIGHETEADCGGCSGGLQATGLLMLLPIFRRRRPSRRPEAT